MMTGDIKSKIDAVWNAFWAGGIANPLEVIEQITYLLFLRRLDDLHTLEENKASRLKQPMERRVFPKGKDGRKGGAPYEDFRWKNFKHFAPADMYKVIGEHVFPFLRDLGGDGSTYAHHMKDARFTIPTPALLAKVVDLLDDVPMEDRDTKGDLYEYMLGKIASAGQNGQFRTPRHIIRLMVEMTAPQPRFDLRPGLRHRRLPGRGRRVPARAPAQNSARCEAEEALPPGHVPRLRFRQHHVAHRQHEHASARRGQPRHPLPRFAGAGSCGQKEAENTPWSWPIRPLPAAWTTRTPPRIFWPSSRRRRPSCFFSPCSCACSSPAVAPPSSCPTACSSARATRTRNCAACWWKSRSWTASCRCPAACSSPTPACPPRSCCSPRPIPAAPTRSGSTTWPPTAGAWTTSARSLLSDDKLGPVPKVELAKDEHNKNNLPDVLARWQKRDSAERKRPRTAQSFCVPKADIAAQGYDLSLNRYKEVVHEEVEHQAPKEILAELAKMETEIQKGMKELEGMVG
jgi:type I restriction enzyme M protein